jgi:hypothetical protein
MHNGQDMATLFLAAILTGTALAGCTTGSTPPAAPASPNPIASASTGYDPTAEPPSPSPNDMRQRANLENERTSSWDHYEIVSPHSIRIYFTLGDPDCYGARAVVHEDPSTVHIRLLEGTLPGAPSVCTDVGMYASLLVTTHDPIGTRSVVSG